MSDSALTNTEQGEHFRPGNSAPDEKRSPAERRGRYEQRADKHYRRDQQLGSMAPLRGIGAVDRGMSEDRHHRYQQCHTRQDLQ